MSLQDQDLFDVTVSNLRRLAPRHKKADKSHQYFRSRCLVPFGGCCLVRLSVDSCHLCRRSSHRHFSRRARMGESCGRLQYGGSTSIPCSSFLQPRSLFLPGVSRVTSLVSGTLRVCAFLLGCMHNRIGGGLGGVE